MVQSILVDSRAPAAHADSIRRKIVEAIVLERGKHYGFLLVQFEIPTVAGLSVYSEANGVPGGMAHVAGEMWVLIDGSETNRGLVRRGSRSSVEAAGLGGSTPSWPLRWAPLGNRRIRFYPPTSAGHVLRFEGVKRPPPPAMRYDEANAAWVFPDGGSFTNEWFDFDAGYHIIEHAAAAAFAKDVLSDDKAAARHLASYGRAVRASTLELESETMPDRPSPWPKF